jgi:hypothetical protein
MIYAKKLGLAGVLVGSLAIAPVAASSATISSTPANTKTDSMAERPSGPALSNSPIRQAAPPTSQAGSRISAPARRLTVDPPMRSDCLPNGFAGAPVDITGATCKSD